MLKNIVELNVSEYITTYMRRCCVWSTRVFGSDLSFALLQQIEQLDQLNVLATGKRMRLLGFVDEHNQTWPFLEVGAGPDGQMIYTHTYDLRSYETNAAYKAALGDVMIPLDLGEGPRTFPILRCNRLGTLGPGAFAAWLKSLRFDLTSHFFGAKSRAVRWRVADGIGALSAMLITELAMEHRQHINALQGRNDIWSAYWTWAQEAQLGCIWTLAADSFDPDLARVRQMAAAVKIIPGAFVCNVDNIAFTLRPEFKPYSLALTGLAYAARHTVFSSVNPRDLNLGTNLHGNFPYKDALGVLDHETVWSMPLAPAGLSTAELLEHFTFGKVAQ